MPERENLITELGKLETWLRQRMDGASKESQNRYFLFAETCRMAATSIYSDGETIREYEDYFERMEDDGR